MFNRYWRTYPWVLQIVLFMLAVFTLFWFGQFIVLATVPKLSGFSLKEITSLNAQTPRTAVLAGLATQAVLHAFIFAVPGIMFALFTHPRFREYLGMRAPGKRVHWLLVTSIMLGLIPVVLWGESWMAQHVHLGKWADELTKTGQETIGAFLSLNRPTDIFFLLCVMAFLPALGEEIVFRGIFLRLLHRRATTSVGLRGNIRGKSDIDPQRAMLFPVVFSSLLFAFLHPTSPYGFAFIFLAGCILALTYYLTGSLLCSIWGHFLYNGSQLLAVFYSPRSSTLKHIVEGGSLPIVYPIAGLLLFVGSFYLLVKLQTPMPADWSNDFKGEVVPVEDGRL
jgi:membrane protease YdiL (CAAX protease family)